MKTKLVLLLALLSIGCNQATNGDMFAQLQAERSEEANRIRSLVDSSFNIAVEGSTLVIFASRRVDEKFATEGICGVQLRQQLFASVRFVEKPLYAGAAVTSVTVPRPITCK